MTSINNFTIKVMFWSLAFITTSFEIYTQACTEFTKIFLGAWKNISEF